MSNFICPNCDHANTPGSKFCNNCGNRLPPSDTIICPNCQTANPASLFYCDNCGARLVKRTLPTEIESDPGLDEIPDQTPFRPAADLFSLPTRKPGDTGQLDPNAVPDWLRTGSQEGKKTDPTAAESSSQQAESVPSDRGATDELPDWLFTDSVADIFQPPSEITTEAFRQMTDEMPFEIKGKTGITDDLNLPDWLTDAVRDTGTLPDNKPGTAPTPKASELPDVFQTTTNIPDWLAEFGGVPSRKSQATDEIDETPKVEDWDFAHPNFDESPDWLTDSPQAEGTTAKTGEETPAWSQPDFDESPDRLLDARAAGVAEVEIAAEPLNWGDWGTAVAPSASPPEWYDELSRPNAQTLAQWLTELDKLEEPEFVIDQPEAETIASRLNDWLSEGGDSTDEQGEAETKIVTGMLTDWLSDLNEPAEEDEEQVVTGMLTDWLSDLDETSASSAITNEAEPEPDTFTDWLAGTGASNATGQPEADEFTDWLTDGSVSDETPLPADEVEAEEPEPGTFTDWLTRTAGATKSEQPDAELGAGEFTDWLAGTSGLAADQPEVSEMNEFNDWLAGMDESSAPVEEGPEPNIFTDWLTGTADPTDQPETGPTTGGFTDWLANMDKAKSAADDSVSGEVEPDIFTDWLAGTVGLAGDDEPQVGADSDEFTDWLAASNEIDEFHLVEDESIQDVSESDGFSSWLTGDDTPPEADFYEEDTASEEKAVTGMLTDWLFDLEESEEDEIVGGEEKAVTGTLTGWLTELDEAKAEAFTEDEELEPGLLTDWLAEPDELPEVVEEETADTSTFSGWLTTPAAGLPDSEEPEELSPPEDLTDWLMQLKEEGAEDEAVTAEAYEAAALFDWMQEATSSEVAADEVAAEELPDWFDDFSQAADEPAASDIELDDFTGNLFAEGDEGDLELDWLQAGTGDLFAEEEEVAETADSTIERQGDFASWQDADAIVSEESDWMSELDSLETGSFNAEPEIPDFNRRFADVIAYPELESEPGIEEELPPALPTAAAFTDDDLDDSYLSEDEAVEAFPDWLTNLGDAAGQEKEQSSELIQEDLPAWLSNMKPSAVDSQASSLPGFEFDSSLIDDFAEIPKELSGADLPDWLQGIPTSFRQGDGDTTQIEHSSDIPDWLRGDGGRLPEKDSTSQLRSILRELPPPRDPKEGLARAEIPEWLDALKPKELKGGSQPTEPVGPAPKSGPLLGVKGVIEIAPIIAASHIAQELPLSQLTITAEQQQQLAVLQQLAQSEVLPSATAVTPRRRFPWGRILLSFILLAVMSAAILLDNDLSLLPETKTTAPPAITAVEMALEMAEAKPVLVAFDYTPALGGELDAVAEAVMAQLAANGSQVIAVSQYAAGTAVAAAYTGEPALFIPGEAIGLRQLGGCLADGCELVYGRSLETNLTEVSLIIILTGERKHLLNWIEQVGSQTSTPVLAGTTQALEPVALSYITSEQLNGLLSYQVALGQYEDVLPGAEANTAAQRSLNAQIMTQLLLVIILLFSLLWQIVRSSRKR